VTIATSTGLVLVGLLVHFGAGLLGLVSGFLALLVAKGSTLHRRSGMVFVYAMITLGVMATGLALYERKWSTVLGGPFTAYLVFTGMTAVRPLEREPRGLSAGMMLAAAVMGLANIAGGVKALTTARGTFDGVPAGMYFFLATISLLAAFGDLRTIQSGALAGSRRLARHLWRMCFALFVASGSFFFGQIQFLPKGLRIPALVAIPALAPLVLLLYWMWRVRARRNLRGLLIARAAAGA
jgi:hypothetical protein